MLGASIVNTITQTASFAGLRPRELCGSRLLLTALAAAGGLQQRQGQGKDGDE